MSANRPLPPIFRPLRLLVRRLRYTAIRIRLGGKLHTTEPFAIGANAVLLPPNSLRVGRRVMIGRDFHLEANLELGDDVLISSRVAIISNDHDFSRPDRTVYQGGRLRPAQVRLEGDNLIGFGTMIVGNVTIGRGTIVGAGSVVTRDLPPGYICAGVPARPLHQRPRRTRDPIETGTE